MAVKSILIVEDEKDLATSMEVWLKNAGYETHIVGTGDGVLPFLDGRPVDLILLDVMIPGPNGIEVCRMVRANPKTEKIPVIMVTVLSEPMDFAKAMRAGADDYICKPFEFNDLLGKIKKF